MATLVGGSRALALVGAAVTASVQAVARRALALGFVPEDESSPFENWPCPQVSARLVMSLVVVVSIVLVASMLGLVVVGVWQLAALLIARRHARRAARRSSEPFHSGPRRRFAATSSPTKPGRRF